MATVHLLIVMRRRPPFWVNEIVADSGIDLEFFG